MATTRFFTRTISKNKNALVPIWVRLRYGRKIDLYCKADVLTKPDNWSNETQQARQRADLFKHNASGMDATGRKSFNDKIAGLRAAIEAELIKVHQDDITTEWLDTVIDKHWHPDKYRMNLFAYIEMFISRAKTKPKPKTGRPVSHKMISEYEATLAHLKNFAAEKKRTVDFKDIDLKFYDDFIQYLQDQKKAVNTIGKKIQTLKTFLHAATEEGVNHYEGFKSEKFVKLSEETDSIYLNEGELSKLYEKDFTDRPGLEKVRDLFLVGCWTGCRFSDISQIIPENIHEGFIHLKQQKTDNKVIIPLHPVVTGIINKYGGRLPKPISNQKFNDALKIVAELAGINDVTHKEITRGGVKVSTAHKKHELVTTHTARRSFATNLYKSDFQTLSIMKITGHKTEKAFLSYIKVTPDEHAKKLAEHWDRRYLKVV